jgi:predicted XRE-type DNA-binding protein
LFVKGVGNAADAAERRLRVQLAERVNTLLAAHRVNQFRAAQMLDISQPHVSELKNYKLDRFTSARLLRFLTLLDRDVDIVIRRKGRGRMVGLIRVSEG